MSECSTVEVNLKNNAYKIRIGSDLSNTIKGLIEKLTNEGKRCFVVTDENVAKNLNTFVCDTLNGTQIFTLPARESTKSFEYLEKICDFLKENGADRRSCIIALGGGVVGDLSGFAAASYMRGIDYYHIPTTLLAMVDSAIGGKTGINLKSGKNLVGAVHQPKEVFINTTFLETLPDREFSSGMAEVIKAGMLGDKDLFYNLLESPTLNKSNVTKIIQQSCQLKSDIVAADEKEENLSSGRVFLNLGHTFGHAIEALTEYQVYKHGEAVSIGLVMAARYSEEIGNIETEDVDNVKALLKHYALPTLLQTPLATDKLLDRMHNDKKNLGGKLRLVGLESIGKACMINDVNENLVKSLWREVGAL